MREEPMADWEKEAICKNLRDLDVKYSTPPASPLHHDARWCPVHRPDHRVC